MISLIFTIAAIAVVINLIAILVAKKYNLLDTPDVRKQHQGAIPLTGGIAIFLTLLTGTLALNIAPFTNNMLMIATVIFLVGVYDDRHHIKASIRLLIEYGSGIALATYGGIAIVNAGNLLTMGDIPLLALSIPLTALSVAGLSNAYNMIDGIDGLAATTIALPLLILLGLASSVDHSKTEALLLMVVPICVFLVFNLGPNKQWLPKIFLGDGGSITLGFLVTAALVYFSQGENALIRPVTALWLVTVPLMDMIATMLRRWKGGRKLMEADRSHLHHTLMSQGFSQCHTLITMIGYMAISAFIGLQLESMPESLSLFLYCLLFGAHCLYVVNSEPNCDYIQ